MSEKEEPPGNPIGRLALQNVMNFIRWMMPEGTTDPEQALRSMIPTLRHVVIRPMDNPTVEQLRALQNRSEFASMSLVRIKRALASGELRTDGPVPERLARMTAGLLELEGIKADIVPLSEEETAKELVELDNPPEYFRKTR